MNTRPADFSAAQAATSLTQFRSASPLVHCLTNDVVQSFTANVLLALNASPAMVVDPEEAAQFSLIADALLINVGTLEHRRADAMRFAVNSAYQVGTMVAVTGVLDYVTDGERDMAVTGGDSMMTRVVGTGCALSAVAAGFCSLEGDRLSHVVAACYVMAFAGQQAASVSQGTGSFILNFLDRIYTLRAEDLV
ncbi:hydroxyethylthiazole kinase [Pectobacterium sp. B2J-2]|uniref:hydroxyethylthiazole kinase n=1 Tax=Pectobacterium sp. B2J-2 TaxID=3385372 RepID=UPI0038FD21D4